MNEHTQRVATKKRQNETEEDTAEEQPELKRLKTNAVSKRNPCLLLDFLPEIQRHIYSFLTLKEGLEVRRTCQKMHSSNDVFQYCNILAFETDGSQDRAELDYYGNQLTVICNLGSADKLRALLRNESLPSPSMMEHFIGDMISCSKSDNGEAMSILLQDGRFKVTIVSLHEALQKDCSEMAAVLQEDERIMEDIRICALCSTNVACHPCSNDSLGEDWNSCMVSGSMYCVDCTLWSRQFCKICAGYLCRTCCSNGTFRSCQTCDGIVCFSDYCHEKFFCLHRL